MNMTGRKEVNEYGLRTRWRGGKRKMEEGIGGIEGNREEEKGGQIAE